MGGGGTDTSRRIIVNIIVNVLRESITNKRKLIIRLVNYIE